MSPLAKWFGHLHGGQVVLLQIPVAFCGTSGLVVAFIAQAEREPPKSSISRATSYATYETNREDTLSNADLWEVKVDQGLSNDEALVYTALRPKGSSPPSFTDSAKALLKD